MSLPARAHRKRGRRRGNAGRPGSIPVASFTARPRLAAHKIAQQLPLYPSKMSLGTGWTRGWAFKRIAAYWRASTIRFWESGRTIADASVLLPAARPQTPRVTRSGESQPRRTPLSRCFVYRVRASRGCNWSSSSVRPAGGRTCRFGRASVRNSANAVLVQLPGLRLVECVERQRSPPP